MRKAQARPKYAMHISSINTNYLLTLAAKRRRRGHCTESFGDFCPSVRRNPPMLNGKGRLHERKYAFEVYRTQRNSMVACKGHFLEPYFHYSNSLSL